MKYEDSEFKGMRFPIHKVSEDFFKKIPELANFPEFLELYKVLLESKLDFNKVFRYIALLHDIKSPIIRYEQDIRKRKIEAASIADFPKKEDEFETAYTEIMYNSGKYKNVINRAIIRYCRLQNEQAFFDLCIYDIKKIDNSELLLDSTKGSDIKSILESNKMMSDMISDAKAKLLNDDNKNLENELLEEISNYNLELTPEQLIINREARDKVMKQGNPYGNYTKVLFTFEEMSDETFNQLMRDSCNDTDAARRHFKDLGLETEGEITIKKQREKIETYMKDVKERRENYKPQKKGGRVKAEVYSDKKKVK